MGITLVSCLDMGFGIGDKDNNLLFDLPKDKKFFKSVTSGKICVMGRKTWDSLPIKPLPNRKNYVLTRDKSFKAEGAEVLHSVEEVLELAKTREVMVIGGGEVYKQFMPYATKMILTHVHTVDFRARVFFPDFTHREWKLVKAVKHEADETHPYSFTFATYERYK